MNPIEMLEKALDDATDTDDHFECGTLLWAGITEALAIMRGPKPPPISEWPEWAPWCAVDPCGSAVVFAEKPYSGRGYWRVPFGVGRRYLSDVHIPIGCDWRTLIWSREDCADGH